MYNRLFPAIALVLALLIPWSGGVTAQTVSENKVANQSFWAAMSAIEEGKPSEQLVEAARIAIMRAYGPSSFPWAVNVHVLAKAHKRTGNYDAAASLLEEALEIYKALLEPENPNIDGAQSDLANIYTEQGRSADAKPLYERALAMLEQRYGSDDYRVSIRLMNLAVALTDEGEFAEAETLFRRALTIRENKFGPQHESVVRSLIYLAHLYLARDGFATAEPIYERALMITEQEMQRIEQELGSEHKDLDPVLRNYAKLLRATGLSDEADEMEARAQAIREKNKTILFKR